MPPKLRWPDELELFAAIVRAGRRAAGPPPGRWTARAKWRGCKRNNQILRAPAAAGRRQAHTLEAH